MGLDRTIRFPSPTTPSWGAVCEQLARVGESAPLRMIDNLPAFPDETPPDDWKELRVGTVAGMVTVRRAAGAIVCVIWGNADPSLNAAWEKVVWACAAAGGGLIETPAGPQSADAFARGANLNPT